MAAARVANDCRSACWARALRATNCGEAAIARPASVAAPSRMSSSGSRLDSSLEILMGGRCIRRDVCPRYRGRSRARVRPIARGDRVGPVVIRPPSARSSKRMRPRSRRWRCRGDPFYRLQAVTGRICKRIGQCYVLPRSAHRIYDPGHRERLYAPRHGLWICSVASVRAVSRNVRALGLGARPMRCIRRMRLGVQFNVGGRISEPVAEIAGRCHARWERARAGTSSATHCSLNRGQVRTNVAEGRSGGGSARFSAG